MHKHQTPIFQELVLSILPLLKEHTRLDHAGITDHSVSFTDTRLKKNIKKKWTDTSAIQQQAAHTTDQLSSPSHSRRAKQKKPNSSWKMFESFLEKSQENGPLAEKWLHRKSERTRQKKQEWRQEREIKWLPWDFRQGERRQTYPASLRGLEYKYIAASKVNYKQNNKQTYKQNWRKPHMIQTCLLMSPDTVSGNVALSEIKTSLGHGSSI